MRGNQGLALLLAAAAGGCATPQARLEVGTPSGALGEGRLAAAFTIKNRGSAAAEDVQVTALALRGGALAEPKLPVALGAIAPDETSAPVQAAFTGGFAPGGEYALSVEGTFVERGHIYRHQQRRRRHALRRIRHHPHARGEQGALRGVRLRLDEGERRRHPLHPVQPIARRTSRS